MQTNHVKDYFTAMNTKAIEVAREICTAGISGIFA
jgi:hypothetical protein